MATGESSSSKMADEQMNMDADWVLKAMVAMANADGHLDSRETDLIRQVYEDRTGRKLAADEVARAVGANATGDARAQLAAASKTLDLETKEEMVRAAYLVLLADERIDGEERKKLKEISGALQISENHLGAILEDLAIWLAKIKS